LFKLESTFKPTLLTDEGALYVWGARKNGRLGDGQIEGIQAEPAKLDTDIVFTCVTMIEQKCCSLANPKCYPRQLFCTRDHSFALGTGEGRPPRPTEELAAEKAAAEPPAPSASVEPTPEASSEPKVETPKTEESKVEEPKAEEKTNGAETKAEEDDQQTNGTSESVNDAPAE